MGGGELGVLAGERLGDRFPARPGADRKGFERRRIAHHGRMADTVDQLAADAGVERRHQPQPQAGEPLGERRHRDHPPAQPALARVLAHHLAVGQAVGAADLEDPAVNRVELEREFARTAASG